MVPGLHPRLITPAQVDFRKPLVGLFQPVIGAHFARFSAGHAVRRDHSALRQDSDVELFGKFDISYTPITTPVPPVSASYIAG